MVSADFLAFIVTPAIVWTGISIIALIWFAYKDIKDKKIW